MSGEQKLDVFGLLDDLEEEGSESESRNPPKGSRIINLNDAFYWACSDAETVNQQEMEEIADLFLRYGYPGLYFWVLRKRGEDRVEFVDVNRQVEFVRNEERIRTAVPSSSKRAYHKESYTIGAAP